ncbi:MAG TPA: hypothetical protein VFE58_01210 [Tepidisphaeraceae bacterium]|nr:hypothetical protein [Tepidisphaeraceae bacterium]
MVGQAGAPAERVAVLAAGVAGVTQAAVGAGEERSAGPVVAAPQSSVAAAVVRTMRDRIRFFHMPALWGTDP